MKKFALIVPASGKGQRFADEGFKTPKPFLKIGGVPMVERVIGCIPDEFVSSIDIVLDPQHAGSVTTWQDGVRVHWEDAPRRGQGTSVLFALEQIGKYADLNTPVLIMNCDQIVEVGEQQRRELLNVLRGGSKGVIFTFKNDPPQEEHKKWSYVIPQLYFSGNSCKPTFSINGTVEKPETFIPDSKAIVGVFAFSSGEILKNALEDQVALGTKVNNEFYLAPAVNLYMRRLRPVRWCPMVAMGVGTPDDLDQFSIYYNGDPLVGGVKLLNDGVEPLWRLENE